MKAGTTSLYHYLREHPHVFMPKVKELDFFVEQSNWSRGVGWYEEQFAGSGEARCVGEASTAYTKYPHFSGVPAHMASVVPAARLIYVVRDPIERIRSHYEHRVALGAERKPIERALLENPIYVDYSRYASQIDQYLEHFAPEQLLVITAEALRNDRGAAVHRLYEFLGVDPAFVPASLDREFYRTGERRSYPPVVWSARRVLKRYIPKTKQAKELVDSIVLRRRRPEAPASDRLADDQQRVIPEDVEHSLAEVLRGDATRLRRFLGKDFDCWGLDSVNESPGGVENGGKT